MNTGVGCHFLLQCMKVKSESEVAQSGPTLLNPWTAAHQAPPSMGFPGTGCHLFFFLEEQCTPYLSWKDDVVGP